MITTRTKLIGSALAATVLVCLKVGYDVKTGADNMVEAANTAAERINDACKPEDVKKESIPYEYNGFFGTTYRFSVKVEVTGRKPSESSNDTIFLMRATDSYTGGQFDLEFPSPCP